jgi:hypothetical protein
MRTTLTGYLYLAAAPQKESSATAESRRPTWRVKLNGLQFRNFAWPLECSMQELQNMLLHLVLLHSVMRNRIVTVAHGGHFERFRPHNNPDRSAVVGNRQCVCRSLFPREEASNIVAQAFGITARISFNLAKPLPFGSNFCE